MFSFTEEEQELFETIGRHADSMGVPCYVIGGFVRDKILGRPTSDIDFVCVGSGIDLARKVVESLSPRPQLAVYSRFRTAGLHYRGMDLEFVGARKESYQTDSRKPMVEEGSLEDDQNRRDFTINALAVCINSQEFGKLLDPFDGISDLQQRILRTPLDPGLTFSDDPLRMMRGIRFASQLDFDLDAVTLQAISEHKERIKIVSPERITTELNKIILSPVPSVGFRLLFDTGLLEIIFPELHAMQGVEIRRGLGHKDNFYHTLEVLDNLAVKSENLWLRWAAILHDIAKPKTKRFENSRGWTFHGHEALGAQWVKGIFKRMRLPLDHKMKYVSKMVRLHQRPVSLSKRDISDSAIRRLLFEAGDDIEDLMLLCEADITTKNRYKQEQYIENYQFVRQKLKEVEQKDELRNWQPPISGKDIMDAFGISPSPVVGQLKDAIREAILDGIIPNDKERAWEFLLDKASELNIETFQGDNSPKS